MSKGRGRLGIGCGGLRGGPLLGAHPGARGPQGPGTRRSSFQRLLQPPGATGRQGLVHAHTPAQTRPDSSECADPHLAPTLTPLPALQLPGLPRRGGSQPIPEACGHTLGQHDP